MVPSGNKPPLVTDDRPSAGEFPTTHWTLVSRVRHGGDIRKEALEDLCRLYWYPLYIFLRRQGHSQQDAEDLVQGFLVQLLGNFTFEAAESQKGRLRTFLLHALRLYLVDRQRHQRRLKRGGDVEGIAFEAMDAEERYANEPQDIRDPELLYAAAWASKLLGEVREKLRAEFADSKRPRMFELLAPFLMLDEDPPSYEEVARQLNATEVSVRLMVSRLRAVFRAELRRAVAQTVESPSELEAELRWLRAVLTAR